jgi:cysteine desulfurase / selenocysteine lyase
MVEEWVFANGKSVGEIREEFPILQNKLKLVGTKIPVDLIYLDTAATAQKPLQVLEAVNRYYREQNSNVHRALHTLGEEATAVYEKSRDKVRSFINAEHRHEIVFTRNTTESINLVASSFGSFLGPDDEILLTEMEHHSNLVPWQLLSERTGCTLKFIPINQDGELELDKLDNLLTEKTALLGVVHISNIFGTINDIKSIIDKAHSLDVPVLIDGAQSTPHMAIDVQELDCDFFAFSGHKLYGPMGIGVLYGKEKYLDKMPPYMGGGDMIRSVKLSGSTWNDLPWKFEAGTPNVGGAAGLGSAIDYLDNLDFKYISDYENMLSNYAEKLFSKIEGIKLYGPNGRRSSVFSFTHKDLHPHDMAQFLDSFGIAVRAGHHCAQPAMRKLGVSSMARASLSFYNTLSEIDFLVEKINAAGEYFKNGI